MNFTTVHYVSNGIQQNTVWYNKFTLMLYVCNGIYLNAACNTGIHHFMQYVSNEFIVMQYVSNGIYRSTVC